MTFVVRRDASLTREDLFLNCRQHLTGYKVPRHVVFTDDLPRTNVGNVLHRALRELAADARQKDSAA